MSSELRLNETELLLLQQQMKGNVSGLGYTLQSAGINRADFTGSEEEDIHQHGAIREVDETGDIYKIKFYVNYQEDDTQLDRSVLLTVFGDGHMTCQTPVKPALFDRIIEHISSIREYDNYLTSFNRFVDTVVNHEFRGRTTSRKERYRSNTNQAFMSLVESYFDTTDMSDGNKRLYRTIIANIGIEIVHQGVPDSNEFDDVVSNATLYPSGTEVKDFFTWYAQYEQDNSSLDYRNLEDHLSHLLSERGISWGTPIELIEYASRKYEL